MLPNGYSLVGSEVGERLDNSAEPCDLELRDKRIGVETEVGGQVAASAQAVPAARLPVLHDAIGRGQLDLGPNAVAVTQRRSRAPQIHNQPVMPRRVGDVIAEQMDLPSVIDQEEVRIAIIIVIAHNNGAAPPRVIDAAAG